MSQWHIKERRIKEVLKYVPFNYPLPSNFADTNIIDGAVCAVVFVAQTQGMIATLWFKCVFLLSAHWCEINRVADNWPNHHIDFPTSDNVWNPPRLDLSVAKVTPKILHLNTGGPNIQARDCRGYVLRLTCTALSSSNPEIEAFSHSLFLQPSALSCLQTKSSSAAKHPWVVRWLCPK